MAALVNGDILEHRTIKRDGSRRQVAMNVYHWVVTNQVGTPTSDSEALIFLDNITAPSEKLLMSNKALYHGSDLRRIFPVPPTLPISTILNQGGGSTADDQIPGQVAGLVSLKAALGGRKYRGRKFYPYPPESANDINGNMEGAYQVVLQAQVNLIFATRVVNNNAGTGSVTIVPVLWHRSDSTYDVITSFQARPFWGTQRRRSDVNRTDALPF